MTPDNAFHSRKYFEIVSIKWLFFFAGKHAVAFVCRIDHISISYLHEYVATNWASPQWTEI